MNRIQLSDILELICGTSDEKLAMLASEQLLIEKGSHVFCRGLIEFSNICRRNCKYCGLSSHNKKLKRYLLSAGQILEAAKKAAQAGMDTIVLQSGEGSIKTELLCEIVKDITGILKLPVTLSVGECTAKEYEMLRDAGASRYLLRHETANPALYASLHPGYTLKERIKCLKILSSLGYEIGSGFITGLPGLSLAAYAKDILLCHKLNIKMCGIGPFISQKDTPMANMQAGSVSETLRLISVLRILMPKINIPATTAIASLAPENGQTLALNAGANVLMPNFTPSIYSKNYKIYDAKNSLSTENAKKVISAACRTSFLP